MMLDSHGIDSPDILGIGSSSSASASRIPNESPHQPRTKVQERLPVHAIEQYSQLLEFMDRVARGFRLVAVLRTNPPQPANPGEQSSSAGELRLRHDQIYAKDPFGPFEVFSLFSSALPAFISSASPGNARDTVEKLVAEDGLLRSIDKHMKTSIRSEVPYETRERMSMTCLEVLEEIFKLLEGSSTVRWYEVGVDTILVSVNDIRLSSKMVSSLSLSHACCTICLGQHVAISQFHARAMQGRLPVVQNLEEQLFILKFYDWMCLGDEPERQRRRARRQGDPYTDREASSPQYLRNLLLNGPLRNFSEMAFYLLPFLKSNLTIADNTWTILRKLMEVPGLANATDSGVLGYFGKTRARAHKEAVEIEEKEGRMFQGQRDLLAMFDTVAEKLGLPKLDPVIPPQPDSGALIPPNGSGHAPVDM
jgi:hypothetical protein